MNPLCAHQNAAGSARLLLHLQRRDPIDFDPTRAAAASAAAAETAPAAAALGPITCGTIPAAAFAGYADALGSISRKLQQGSGTYEPTITKDHTAVVVTFHTAISHLLRHFWLKGFPDGKNPKGSAVITKVNDIGACLKRTQSEKLTRLAESLPEQDRSCVGNLEERVEVAVKKFEKFTAKLKKFR